MAELDGDSIAISRAKQLLDKYCNEIAYHFDIAQALSILWKHISKDEEETIYSYDDQPSRVNALISALHTKTPAALQDFLCFVAQYQPEILSKMLIDACGSGKVI